MYEQKRLVNVHFVPMTGNSVFLPLLFHLSEFALPKTRVELNRSRIAVVTGA